MIYKNQKTIFFLGGDRYNPALTKNDLSQAATIGAGAFVASQLGAKGIARLAGLAMLRGGLNNPFGIPIEGAKKGGFGGLF